MPKKKKEAPQKLKISQLAKAAGVSVSTIKFYLKEGLIQPPEPGEGSMSFYNQDHIERILLIKKLQKERFLPLDVIKKMISTELEEGETVQTGSLEDTAWEPRQYGESVALKTVVKRTGLSVGQIDQLENDGFVHSRNTLQGRFFDSVNLKILLLFKSRNDVGLPIDHTREVFSIYQRHLRRAVNEDVLLCLRKILFQKEGADLIKYVAEGETTVEEFVKYCKRKLTQMRVDTILGRHEVIPIRVVEALNFRSLESIAQRLRQDSISIDYTVLLEKVLSGTPMRDLEHIQPDTADPNSEPKPVQHLINGLLDLMEGNSQNALVAFGNIDSSSDFLPLASALKGLAQISQISRISSMMVFIEKMRTVLELFEVSKKQTSNVAADLFAAFCRLVGFSVRPNFFDVEVDAEPVFNEIIDRCDQLLAELSKEDFLTHFLHELMMKSCYFMVLMFQECDLLPRAEALLHKMLAADKDDFYTTWAHRKLAEMNA